MARSRRSLRAAPSRAPHDRSGAADAAPDGGGDAIERDADDVTERDAGNITDGGDVTDGDAGDAAAKPSKTRMKQRMHALQDLGERLVALPPARLAAVPLDESLRQAIEMARDTRSREGRRRQLQYVGRLMRSADADAIEAALAGDDADHQRQVGIHHAAEHWRDGLVEGSLQPAQWWQRFPPAGDPDPATVAAIERLVTAARRSAANGGADPKHARALYRALHRWLLDR